MGISIQSHGIWNSSSGVAAWDPSQLNNLFLWTRGNELTSTFPGPPDYIPFTWGDKSGNNHLLTKSGVGSGLVSSLPGDVNGEDAIYFDGNPGMSSPASPVFALDRPTMFMVFKLENTANTISIRSSGTQINIRAEASVPPNGEIRLFGQAAGPIILPPYPLTGGYNLLRVSEGIPSGNEAIVEINNEGEAASPFTPHLTTSSFTLTNMPGISVAEIIVVNGTPSAQEIQDIKDYVVNRYGITM